MMSKQRLISLGLFVALILSTNVVLAARDFSANPNSGLVAFGGGVVFTVWLIFVTLRTIVRNPVRGTGVVLGIISFFLIALALPFYLMIKLELSGVWVIVVFIGCMTFAYLWLNLVERMFPEVGEREK